MAAVLAFGPGFFARILRQYARDIDAEERKKKVQEDDEHRRPGDEWKPKGWKPDEYEE